MSTTYRNLIPDLEARYGPTVPMPRDYHQNRPGPAPVPWSVFCFASDLRNAGTSYKQIKFETGLTPWQLVARWNRYFPELVDPSPERIPGRMCSHRRPNLDEIEATLASGLSDKEVRLKYNLSVKQLSGIKIRWRVKNGETPKRRRILPPGMRSASN